MYVPVLLLLRSLEKASLCHFPTKYELKVIKHEVEHNRTKQLRTVRT